MSQIPPKIPNVFIEKNTHLCGLMQFKPVLFKSQLHVELMKSSLTFEEYLFSVFLDLGNRNTVVIMVSWQTILPTLTIFMKFESISQRLEISHELLLDTLHLNFLFLNDENTSLMCKL